MKADINLMHFMKAHSEETMNKGWRLFTELGDQIFLLDKKRKKYLIEVPSQTGNGSYNVSLNVVAANVEEHCDCKAFERYLQCKHTVAAALALLVDEFGYKEDELEELIKAGGSIEDFEFSETYKVMQKLPGNKLSAKKTQVENNHQQNDGIQQKEWKKFVKKGNINLGDLGIYAGYYITTFNDLRKIVQTGFDEKALHWTFLFKDKKQQAHPEIKYDADVTYYYRCSCQLAEHRVMCRHVSLAFEHLTHSKGSSYFLQFKNWTKEKNILLQPYGLTIDDVEAKAFQFHVTYYGELQMKAPAGFIRHGDKERLKTLGHVFKSKSDAGPAAIVRPKTLPGTIIDFETGFMFNSNSQRLKLGFELEAVKLFHKQGKTDIKKLSVNQPKNFSLLQGLSDEVYALLLQLSNQQLLDFMEKEGYGFFKNYINPWQQLTDNSAAVLKKHYIECLQRLWPYLAADFQTFLLEERFSTKNCKPVTFSKDTIELSFEVIADDRFITIYMLPLINEKQVSTATIDILHQFIFSFNNALHIIKNIEDLPVLEQFDNGFIKVPASSKFDIIQNIIAPLQERYNVMLPGGFDIKSIHVKPVPGVLLKEFNNQFLMLQAQFVYDETEVEYSPNPEDLLTSLPDGSIQIIKRDTTAEKQFVESLRGLHSSFERQRQNDFFYVHFNEVMKGNWFLNTVRYLQENDITVKGMQELKKFRYNTHKPKWEMKAGSGIDWFDLQVKISFGEQEVTLRDVKKAVLNKQNIVVLGDGTFGVLPEEWLEQYGMLLKMGEEQNNDTLRLSKLHFTIIDDLHARIDDDSIQKEIEEKKQKLKNVENIKSLPLSKNIKATLRPYQLSGFQWLQTLDELGWGGCLADDMGLGKTLQAISFLQYIKEKYKSSTNLVVCPTSLIYNWEAELKKFAPTLRYHIYYGSDREFTEEHFDKYDIVITSYGLVRNDMEQLLHFQWHYVILDESQAIKNPDAQTTKAVQLLKSRNRLILSGTPVQNNTFDLFAQFNFLNPGLLGSKEFYKTEFANPIDKYNDADKSRQLRKMVYPFLLRRVKEEVAKDLPDKTEIILWCELPKEQRSVYEEYKNYYRKMLMQKIEEEGISKAGMYVLEGLLRLRQVCDSPQLVKDAEITTTESIKIEELQREIEENTGTHKLIVFSQFTGMLHLIEEALMKKKITYCYLDGSTPAEKRRQQVDAFQSDESIKIFLISLKAGGVGLNLTAADYVYIVDPWWNPAVEQQAIDRTHRIGQSKKIFAYKMICKDTVEEKIVQLQQRKKQLANELVTEDAGFIKKLNKEDVEFLFS